MAGTVAQTSLDRETEYMRFREIEASGTTRRWVVVSKSSGDALGRVRWYGPWRQFVFIPDNAIFNRACLRDVETFLTDAYDDWRASKKQDK